MPIKTHQRGIILSIADKQTPKLTRKQKVKKKQGNFRKEEINKGGEPHSQDNKAYHQATGIMTI